LLFSISHWWLNWWGRFNRRGEWHQYTMRATDMWPESASSLVHNISCPMSHFFLP
jgi:hypothetical protein